MQHIPAELHKLSFELHKTRVERELFFHAATYICAGLKRSPGGPELFGSPAAFLLSLKQTTNMETEKLKAKVVFSDDLIEPRNPYKAALLRLADLLEETGAKIGFGDFYGGIKFEFGPVLISTQTPELTPESLRLLCESIND